MGKKTILTILITFAVVFVLIGTLVIVDVSLAETAVVELPKLDPTALNILGKKTDLAKPYMTKIFDLYHEATGEKLNIMPIEDDIYEDVALKMQQNGEMADIFLHFHNADLEMFDAEENFLDLRDEAWVSDLTDSAKAYCTDAEGDLLGLPFWESSVSGCYYNKTLLEEKGLYPASNQKEFDTLCAALEYQGITPICWGGNGCGWMAQFGMDPVFADDAALLERLNRNETSYRDIAAIRDMVDWIDRAEAEGWFGAGSLETGWDQISPMLSSGEAAMTFIWDTWFYTDFVDGKYKKEDFALMPIFMGTADEGTYEGGNLNMMMVNKNSERKDDALDFLRFCATPENYNEAFKGISTVSVFKGQATNIQSHMVSEAMASIERLERVSTASTKIIGYSGDKVMAAINAMFGKNGISAAECIRRLDEDRKAEAKLLGAEGF